MPSHRIGMKSEMRNPKPESRPKLDARALPAPPRSPRPNRVRSAVKGNAAFRSALFRSAAGFGFQVAAGRSPRLKAWLPRASYLRLWAFCFAAAGLLGGCAVGPNYQRPAALGPNELPAAFAGAGATNVGEWKSAEPAAHRPRGAWWELFGDAELARLEAMATTNNQQLAAAYANFQQARALVNVARADFFPQVSTAASFTRQRFSANQGSRNGGTGGSATFNTFSVPLDASWELDLWGRVRREVEGARARLAAAADDFESAQLAIQAEVALDYFTLRSLETLHQVFVETIQTYQRSLALTQERHKRGVATELDVSLADTQLKSSEAQLPAIELQTANLRHALATLCGRPATAFVISPPNDTTNALPAIPVELPSELLERRPDIAAAERRMAAANADLGVAHAAFYPRVLLSGMAGYQSIDASTLFNWPSRVWAIGPSVQLPLFTGGRNRAQLAAARAGYDATVANYRQTVLSAFQEVEDQLAAQRLLARQYDAEHAALKSARRMLEISTAKYKGGVSTYLDVAVSQTAALGHQQTVVTLQAARLAASVSLIKALGAGWEADRGLAAADRGREAQTAKPKATAAPAR
jgi:outer membrane protein, multidrug efflux system